MYFATSTGHISGLTLPDPLRNSTHYIPNSNDLNGLPIEPCFLWLSGVVIFRSRPRVDLFYLKDSCAYAFILVSIPDEGENTQCHRLQIPAILDVGMNSNRPGTSVAASVMPRPQMALLTLVFMHFDGEQRIMKCNYCAVPLMDQ